MYLILGLVIEILPVEFNKLWKKGFFFETNHTPGTANIHFIQRGFPSAAAGGAGSELPSTDE